MIILKCCWCEKEDCQVQGLNRKRTMSRGEVRKFFVKKAHMPADFSKRKVGIHMYIHHLQSKQPKAFGVCVDQARLSLPLLRWKQMKWNFFYLFCFHMIFLCLLLIFFFVMPYASIPCASSFIYLSPQNHLKEVYIFLICCVRLTHSTQN